MMFGYGWMLTPWGWAVVCLAAGFCVLLVGAIYWLSLLVGRTGRSESTRTSPTPLGPSAEQILSERFARGEIDEAEYGSRLEKLREPAPH
jgi:putative membrane protein